MASKTDLINISVNVYHDPKIENQYQPGDNWSSIEKLENKNTGFYAEAYRNKNTGEVVIAYRGTDQKDGGDWQNNLHIGIGKTPEQYQDAILFYDEVARKYGSGNVIVTGHSLGGALAQLVGAETGATTVAFNAPGVAHLLPEIGINSPASPSSYSNIKNYSLANDILNLLNIAYGLQQLGGVYIIPSTGDKSVDAHSDFESLKNLDCLEYYMWYFKNQDLCEAIKKLQRSGAKDDIIELLKKLDHLIKEYEQYSTSGFDTMKDSFDKANGAGTPGADPILVDLNGDGVKTTTLENGVYFDHEVDAFAEKSAWVDENDGILVIDKNGNGVIDNGGEIFGDNYIKSDNSKATSGFDALKDLDSNNDGIISVEDESFGLIKILKGDGELISLEEAGIVSIDLNNTSVGSVDENGNTLVSSGSFVKSDGSIGSLGDFNLVVDKMDSFATEWIEETEDISNLPDILGCGTLHTLHQAMMRDKNGNGNLKKLVEDFIAAESEENKKKILGQILYRWTGADKVLVSDGGNHYDGQKLWVIEKFIGEEFKGVDNNGHPNIWAAPFLDDAYNHIANYVYYRLMVQCDDRIKGLFELIELEYDFDDNKVRYNFDKVIGYVDNILSEDEGLGKTKLLEVNEIIQAFGLNNDEGYSKYYEHFAGLGEEYKTLLDIVGRIGINGSEGNDSIEGTVAADAVFGGSGNDTINTRQGDDVVFGGDGNDVIDVCDFGYCYYLNRNKKRDLKMA